MIDPNRSYEQESVERALTCANCGQKLHVLEVHVCSDWRKVPRSALIVVVKLNGELADRR